MMPTGDCKHNRLHQFQLLSFLVLKALYFRLIIPKLQYVGVNVR